MEESSSSKVTGNIQPAVSDKWRAKASLVEYHDPFGLFPLLSPELRARLPLRNLYWKTAKRPLRSIDSLYVDFVPAPVRIESPSAHRTSRGGSQEHDQPGSSGPTGDATVTDGSNVTTRGRRHQIPGLHQTPYLKIFLLRCDNRETYKASAKKLMRDWLRKNVPSSQGTGSSSVNHQENHDAFEWLIIHVVLPDTEAAAQPRWTTASRESSSGPVEKHGSGTRWPVPGSRTILEKLRKNFNLPGKSEPDRVAQIRLQKNFVPTHLLPAGSGMVSSPYSESPQEQENAWLDLFSKFKTLILMAFDQRVLQYEEDIQERNSQRSLPGWNFCTFFVLKEGLAKAFESVGLVEDALAGYDELAAEFNSFIKEQIVSDNALNGGLLSNITKDLQEQLNAAQESINGGETGLGGNDAAPWRTDDLDHSNPLGERKKRYTDLLLSNTISVFDLECYVFSRQMTLLLRLGNAKRPQLANGEIDSRPRSSSLPNINEVGHTVVSEENLSYLAQLCQRAVSFATSVARIMREDLLKGASPPLSDDDARVIDQMVRSWTFDVVRQVLDSTYVPSVEKLPHPDGQASAASVASRRVESSPVKPSDQAGPKPILRPAQTTPVAKLNLDGAEPSDTNARPASQVIYENERFSNSEPHQRQPAAASEKTVRLDLAARRAELLLIQRKIVTDVGRASGWLIGWDSPQVIRLIRDGVLDEVAVHEEGDDETVGGGHGHKTSREVPFVVAYRTPVLRAAATSIDEYRIFYESLSDRALQHYLVAELTKSAESIMKDLAVLQFERGHYANAAAYFGRTASFYANDRWNSVEGAMLKMHAQCLKELNRIEDYVRVILTLLSKVAAVKQSRITMQVPRMRNGDSTVDGIRSRGIGWLDDDHITADRYLSEVVIYSTQLRDNVSVAMSTYFSDIQVDPYINHFPDKDGFGLQLCFRHLLDDNITVDHISIRLSSTKGQNHDIWLQADSPLHLEPGMRRVWLRSNTTTLGFYTVDKITLEAGRISFVHETLTQAEAANPLDLGQSTPVMRHSAKRRWRVLCYPRLGALQATLTQSRSIHLDKARSIDLEISSFNNDIDRGEVRLRSATAGLRLRTGAIHNIQGDVSVAERSQPGTIEFSGLQSRNTMRLEIPYELEMDVPELQIRVQVKYHTKLGDFVFQKYETIKAALLLDVNVHDTFTADALLSEFAVRTATSMPIEILEVQLEKSDVFSVQPSIERKQSVVVLPGAAAHFGYQISKKDKKSLSGSQNAIHAHASLPLTLTFCCVDEEVVHVVETVFRADISQSPFSGLCRLMTPYVTKSLLEHFSLMDFEKIASSRKLDLSLYDRFGLESVVTGLPSGTQATFLDWLVAWRKANRAVTIPAPGAGQDRNLSGVHRLIIPFQVPQAQFVHTVSLQGSEQDVEFPPSGPVAVGQPLLAELGIKHTRQWGNLASTDDGTHSLDRPFDFVFEIEGDPEYWLIAGQRKARFSAKEDELITFPVILVPLKPGNLSLPRVDVQPWTADKGAKLEIATMSCETDYRNRTQTVVVIRNYRSTTVNLDFDAPEGSRARLVDVAYRRTKDAVESAQSRGSSIIIPSVTDDAKASITSSQK